MKPKRIRIELKSSEEKASDTRPLSPEPAAEKPEKAKKVKKEKEERPTAGTEEQTREG